MNVVGETVTVLSSSDPTKAGRSGKVLLETAKTLVIAIEGEPLRFEKKGSAFRILGSGKVLTGSDIAGRLQDRWGKARA